VADGANPNPTIRPFDKPPATASAPANVHPAAQG
jgi:hypothetical protein